MSIDDLAARESMACRTAEKRLAAKVQKGADQQIQIIQKVSEEIKDRLEYPSTLAFEIEEGNLRLNYREGKSVSIHPHAMGQIADVTGVPRRFASSLLEGTDWEQELLGYNLNTIFQNRSYLDRSNRPVRHLHRIVGGQLRGLVSRMFNRNLSSKKLLRTFIEVCSENHAGPVEGHASDVRVWLKCMLPVVFEPIDGEFVALGVTFGNSDFSAGALRITNSIMRIQSGTISVKGDDAFHRTHLGRVIDDDDIDLSSETNKKELEAARSGIRDIVNARLSKENISNTLEAIRAAREMHIDWHEFRQAMRTVLSKKELEGVEAVIEAGIGAGELPPVDTDEDGTVSADAWWASNVAGFFAREQRDPDKKAGLQDLAGSFVAGKYGKVKLKV